MYESVFMTTAANSFVPYVDTRYNFDWEDYFPFPDAKALRDNDFQEGTHDVSHWRPSGIV
jgi:hypothetical protein